MKLCISWSELGGCRENFAVGFSWTFGIGYWMSHFARLYFLVPTGASLHYFLWPCPYFKVRVASNTWNRKLSVSVACHWTSSNYTLLWSTPGRSHICCWLWFCLYSRGLNDVGSAAWVENSFFWRLPNNSFLMPSEPWRFCSGDNVCVKVYILLHFALLECWQSSCLRLLFFSFACLVFNV